MGDNDNTSICAGCSKVVPDRQFLVCSNCKDAYDLFCANISETRFYGTMGDERKRTWVCPRCKSNQPKRNNTNTPIRQLLSLADCSDLIQNNVDDDLNVTIRKKTKPLNIDESLQSTSSPPAGETISISPSPYKSDLILMELRALRSQVTEQYKNQDERILDLTQTIKEIQITVEKEMSAIRLSTSRNAEKLNELETANMQLRKELDSAKKAIVAIENKLECHTSSLSPTYASIAGLELTQTENPAGNSEVPNESKCLPPVRKISLRNNEQQPTSAPEKQFKKTIVMYGLNEYEYENDFDLHNRIIDVFYEIANIDLTGYIEDINRIGRRGWRRPLVIELLSKRMTKYILSNTRNFRNTGLWISEFLDEQGLSERKQQRQKFMKNSQHKTSAATTSKQEFPSTYTLENFNSHKPILNKTKSKLSKDPNYVYAHRKKSSFRE